MNKIIDSKNILNPAIWFKRELQEEKLTFLTVYYASYLASKGKNAFHSVPWKRTVLS